MVSIYFSKSPIKSTEFKVEHINNALTIPLFYFFAGLPDYDSYFRMECYFQDTRISEKCHLYFFSVSAKHSKALWENLQPEGSCTPIRNS